MKVLAYWAARTAIFLAVVAVLWALGWLDIVMLVAAVVIAWAIGYIALPGMRAAANQQMDGWVHRSEKGLRDLDAEEDAEAYGSAGQTPDAGAGSDDTGAEPR